MVEECQPQAASVWYILFSRADIPLHLESSAPCQASQGASLAPLPRLLSASLLYQPEKHEDSSATCS